METYFTPPAALEFLHDQQLSDSADCTTYDEYLKAMHHQMLMVLDAPPERRELSPELIIINPELKSAS